MFYTFEFWTVIGIQLTCSPLLTLGQQRRSFHYSTIVETTTEDVTYVSSTSSLGVKKSSPSIQTNLDVLDLLKEGQRRVSVWTKLAGEYWRRGYLAAAERIAHSAIECASPSSSPSYNSPKCIRSITCKWNDSFISSDIRTSRKYSDSSWPPNWFFQKLVSPVGFRFRRH
jgi:hypothetical protein